MKPSQSQIQRKPAATATAQSAAAQSAATAATAVTALKTRTIRPVFETYSEHGPPLLTGPEFKLVGTFRLRNTNCIIANTLRRSILSFVRSVGFKIDLTNTKTPGCVIRKNTSVIFNEMLAHRIAMLPLAVRDVDGFDVSKYSCVLNVQNTSRGSIREETILHVTASDFRVFEGEKDLGRAATDAMFPPDPITRQTCLLATLRPQWNPDQPSEQIDLTVFPVIGSGSDNISFSPVSQCSFSNTLDTDPARVEAFFQAWVAENKKNVVAPATAAATATTSTATAESYRREWMTLDRQRCFLVDENGEANSFDFTIESVGIRPVPDIVAEGITAIIRLLSRYTDMDDDSYSNSISIRSADCRMTNAVDVFFDGQDHTLGNLLQANLSDFVSIEVGSNKPLVFAGYKVPHPLKKEMMIRLGFREGVEANDTNVRSLITDAARRSLETFTILAQEWNRLVGASSRPESKGV